MLINEGRLVRHRGRVDAAPSTRLVHRVPINLEHLSLMAMRGEDVQMEVQGVSAIANVVEGKETSSTDHLRSVIFRANPDQAPWGRKPRWSTFWPFTTRRRLLPSPSCRPTIPIQPNRLIQTPH
jgi:hypothetical protein